jgi:hypothetical protein
MCMELINELQRADAALTLAGERYAEASHALVVAYAAMSAAERGTTAYALACVYVKRAKTLRESAGNVHDTAYSKWHDLYNAAVAGVGTPLV